MRLHAMRQGPITQVRVMLFGASVRFKPRVPNPVPACFVRRLGLWLMWDSARLIRPPALE